MIEYRIKGSRGRCESCPTSQQNRFLLVITFWLLPRTAAWSRSRVPSFPTLPLPSKRATICHVFPKEIPNYESRRSLLTSLSTFWTLVVATDVVHAADLATSTSSQGIPVVTDSNVGRAFRRSAVRGAQLLDQVDEGWERFSDGLRDQQGCDANTGRRLYDNGFRRDGTRVGNPVLGALCKPEPLLPFQENLAQQLLNSVNAAAMEGGSLSTSVLEKSIQSTQDLVRASFERSMDQSTSPDEERRKQFNFELYTRLRAINTLFQPSLDRPTKEGNSKIRSFQLALGEKLLATLAPSASRQDYISPFPEKEDELQDYDYDKNVLLDALGALRVTLNQLQAGGVVGRCEISIPYDDYGSVVTVALDDYVPMGTELLLAEQQYTIGALGPALLRATMRRAKVTYALDTFYIDPSTTKQSEYNPTQLLLSLSNLSQQ